MGSLKKSEEMKRYEEETGKKAIWRGSVTKGFKKWKNGETVYTENKERIAILVTEDIKTKWQRYANENNFSSISKLIRRAVNFYVDSKFNKSYFENKTKLSHALKEPLTAIKGFSQIILEKYSEKLDVELILNIKEIFTQSKSLERKIDEILIGIEADKLQYDVLIIDDDVPTIRIATDYFGLQGKTCKGVRSGAKSIEELKIIHPKLILIDVILPDIDGFDLCKKIKTDKELKHIPIFYISAIPDSVIRDKFKKTGAEGYISKPFDIADFKPLLEYL